MEEGERGLGEGILALYMETGSAMLSLQVEHEAFPFFQFIWCNDKLIQERGREQNK